MTSDPRQLPNDNREQALGPETQKGLSLLLKAYDRARDLKRKVAEFRVSLGIIRPALDGFAQHKDGVGGIAMFHLYEAGVIEGLGILRVKLGGALP